MLKKMVNHAAIEFRIIPVDPLLIKSGQATVGGVDMSFVRTYRFGEEDKVYIPGSSLKGVFRSYAEKICRSLREEPVPVCLPYLNPGNKSDKKEAHKGEFSCGLWFEKYKKDNDVDTIPSHDVYRLSCPTCRLFGSHGFIGRFAASDAYPVGHTTLETRDGVAIDRLTGGAFPGAKYDLEVLTRGEFSTTIEIRNFERWQLGLIALILRDMEQGLVRIGFGKSRGLGRIRIEITNFQVTYYNRPVAALSGLGSLCTESEIGLYGFSTETTGATSCLPLPSPQINGLRHEYEISQTWKDSLAPAVDDLLRYVQGVQWPGDLLSYVKGEV